jgi:hypothetical protein
MVFRLYTELGLIRGSCNTSSSSALAKFRARRNPGTKKSYCRGQIENGQIGRVSSRLLQSFKATRKSLVFAKASHSAAAACVYAGELGSVDICIYTSIRSTRFAEGTEILNKLYSKSGVDFPPEFSRFEASGVCLGQPVHLASCLVLVESRRRASGVSLIRTSIPEPVPTLEPGEKDHGPRHSLLGHLVPAESSSKERGGLAAISCSSQFSSCELVLKACK